jgi:hypothetical protein
MIETVEVHKYANPTTFVGKDTGKIIGGRVMFKGADPMHPVIFLNQSGYSIQNLKTKKRMVFYDTTRKILVKPSSLGGEAGSVDDMSVAVQQVLAAEGDTSKELGINESNKYWSLLGLAAFALGMIFGLLGAYLMIPHNGASTSSPQSTSVLGLGVIPNSTVHINSGGGSGNTTQPIKTT